MWITTWPVAIIKFLEHPSYAKTKNPKSGCNKDDYGPTQVTMQLIKKCNKGLQMNYLEEILYTTI
jgi:hypothetical protein